jgi:hypothetical protein
MIVKLENTAHRKDNDYVLILDMFLIIFNEGLNVLPNKVACKFGK